MKHRNEIEEHVVEYISGDAGLIIDMIGRETIEDLVADFDDEDLQYYFEEGCIEYDSIEDLIEEKDAEEAT